MSGYYEFRHTVGFDEAQIFNVHFTTYLRWQRDCQDRFLREIAPAAKQAHLRLHTVKAECEFFVGITAEDELSIRMRLEELTSTRLQFTFDYVRVLDGAECLVARGRQRVACVVGAGAEEAAVPVFLRAALLPYVETPVSG